MTVEIKIIGEDAGHALRELGGLSAGLLGTTSLSRGLVAVPASTGKPSGGIPTEPEAAVFVEAVGSSDLTPQPDGSAKVRERGKPAPGRARRTKDEIAEDEAADAADAAGETSLGIQSGGERVNPEEAAQDAADEAAEDAKVEQTFTADDVRNAMGLYVNKFGMDAAQADGPGLLVDTIGNPPEGNPFWKLSLIPEDKYAVVTAAWQAAAKAEQRYKRRGA